VSCHCNRQSKKHTPISGRAAHAIPSIGQEVPGTWQQSNIISTNEIPRQRNKETNPSVALRWAHRFNDTVKNTLVHHLLSLLADDNRKIPLQQTLKDMRSAFWLRLGEDDERELTSHIGCVGWQSPQIPSGSCNRFGTIASQQETRDSVGRWINWNGYENNNKITMTRTTKMMSIQKLISAIVHYGCNACRNGPFLHTSLMHGVCSKYGGRRLSRHKNLEEITSKQFLKNNIVKIKIEECSRLRNSNNVNAE
jgi:hypothetical protein